MQDFQVSTREQVPPAAQAIFDNLQKRVGLVPNLYATIGHSPSVPGACLAFQQALVKDPPSPNEREAIFLAVPQINGFSEDETSQLRPGTHTDPTLGPLTRLAAAPKLAAPAASCFLPNHQGRS